MQKRQNVVNDTWEIMIAKIISVVLVVCVFSGIAIFEHYRNTVEIKPQTAVVSTVVEENSELIAKNNNIKYDVENVLTPSNLTASELKSRLAYNLIPYAELFVRAEKEYGVNAVFLASVSALESGWGKSELAKDYNNLFGWSSANDPSGYAKFSSAEECVMYVAKSLKENYLTEGGCYYNGKSVSGVNKRYNGRKSWEENVTAIMSEIGDVQ